MKLRNTLIGALCSSALLTVACAVTACTTEDDRVTLLQAPLEATVAPCIPFPGSDVDPCEPLETSWRLTRAHIGDFTSERVPAFPFDTYNDLKRWAPKSWCWEGLCLPLIWIRATVVPGSIRCGEIHDVLYLDDGKVNVEEYPTDDDTHGWSCYVDVVVNEYLNGTGPKRLELWLIDYWQSPETESDEKMRTLAEGSYGFGLSEGREFIIPLGRPYNLAIAAWLWLHIPTLDVQRTDNGEVIVVTHWGRTNARNLQDSSSSLNDFREMTRDAMERYYRETGGRVGTPGKNPIAPMNASREGLSTFLRELGGFSVEGIVPVTPVPPLRQPNETPTPYPDITAPTGQE